MSGETINAVAFDLGYTLVEYQGVPPSWELISVRSTPVIEDLRSERRCQGSLNPRVGLAVANDGSEFACGRLLQQIRRNASAYYSFNVLLIRIRVQDNDFGARSFVHQLACRFYTV